MVLDILKKQKGLTAALCLSTVMISVGCSEGASLQAADLSAVSSVPFSYGNSEAQSGSNPSVISESSHDIGPKAALSAALNHAGLDANNVDVLKSKLDNDSAVLKYDIEFVTETDKYEYEINASNGSVLEFSSERLSVSLTSDNSLTNEASTLTNTGVISNSTNDSLSLTPVQSVNDTLEVQTVASNITEQQAKNAALDHAGVSSANAVFNKVKLENDNGISVYDIEFTANSTEYDYEIKASDGTVIEYSSKVLTPVQGTISAAQTVQSNVTEQQAKNAALDHAGVSSANAVFNKVKLENDDGISVYDIEFTANSIEYDYEIKASDGTVLKYSSEPVYVVSQSNATEIISIDDAKNIALNYVGIDASQVTFTKTELDDDNGISIYEIEFISNSTEYEFEIAANGGAVLEYSDETQYADDHHYEYHHDDYHH